MKTADITKYEAFLQWLKTIKNQHFSKLDADNERWVSLMQKF